jgi:hypothetical protein
MSIPKKDPQKKRKNKNKSRSYLERFHEQLIALAVAKIRAQNSRTPLVYCWIPDSDSETAFS